MVAVRGEARPTLADINALITSAAAEGIVSRYAALDQLTYADVLPRTRAASAFSDSEGIPSRGEQ